jgi:cytochrome c-type biogenesis protein CcmH
MSMLWIVLTLLMVATVCGVVLPFVLKRSEASGTEAAVYVAQLKEIDREESLGLVPADDAALARLEIKRRLARTRETLPILEEAQMRKSDQFALIGVVSALAVGSALIYGAVGAPSVPSAPLPSPMAVLDGPRSGPAMGNASASVGSVDEMVVKLEARLAEAPNDVEGWRMLGWSRFRTGDVEGAKQAYEKAVELVPDDANTLSALGEAQVRAAGGRVDSAAAAVLQRAVELQPNDPRARFLLGLKKEQDGDSQGALDDWIGLLNTAQPGDAWAVDVRGRILELSDASGIDVGDRLPGELAPQASGPTAQDISAADEMSPEERAAMIEGMVARLDQKLRDDPSDLEGWVRLIKARRVLQQEDLAAEAVTRAKAAFAASASDLQTIEAAASAPVGMPPG